jgi:hypothetical protein
MPLIRKPRQPSSRSRPGSAEILHGLVSSNPDERWAAARAAAENPDLAAELAAALPTETDSRVCEAMFTSLARMDTSVIARHILPLLRSTDAALRTGALDALRSSLAAVSELLPQLLRDRDIDVRILSCELARSLPGAEATRQLCALLRDEREVNVCAAAIEVLAEVGDPEALPILAQCEQRFAEVPFLCFAIQVATERLTSQSARIRG